MAGEQALERTNFRTKLQKYFKRARAKRKNSLSPLSVGSCFKMKQKGFTVVEFSITVAILVLVAMVGIPAFQNLLREARNATVKASLAELRAAIQTFSAREIAAGRASRSGVGTSGGWPTVGQINEAKYGGSNVVLPSQDVPENPWAKVVFPTDYDLVRSLSVSFPGGPPKDPPPDLGKRFLGEGVAYAAFGDLPSEPAGWVYDPNTGQIWAATNVNGENYY